MAFRGCYVKYIIVNKYLAHSKGGRVAGEGCARASTEFCTNLARTDRT
jgi:hypothetical protein